MKFGSLSGSLQRLIDGLEYLTGGIGVDITTNSFQQVVVSLAAGAGAPGAPNESIQFNNAGAFDGSANLTYDGTVVRITGSLAAGLESNAAGLYSVAEGFGTLAFGDYSHTEGYLTTASALYSHAEGESTIASTNADGSHVEGLGTIASGTYQHVQGRYNKRDNNYSLMVIGNGTGDDNTDRSDILRVEMSSVQVSGSVLQSGSTSVIGFMGGAPGSPMTIGDDVFFFVSGSSGSMGTTDRGVAAFGGDVSISGSLKVGTNSITITTNYIQLGSTAHKVTKTGSDLVFYDDNVPAGATLSSLIGGGGGTPSAPVTSVQYNNAGAFGGSSDFTYDSSNGSLYLTGSFMQGLENFAVGDFSHAEGTGSFALGDYSHAEGSGSVAYGTGSHAEGGPGIIYSESFDPPIFVYAIASGNYSHAEGGGTTSRGEISHAEGTLTLATGRGSHVEGNSSHALGDYSHAEGFDTLASAQYSHAEGDRTTAKANMAHAEGAQTFASGNYSHAEGYITYAEGTYSHAEGYQTKTKGVAAHSEGNASNAFGDYSHAEGRSSAGSRGYIASSSIEMPGVIVIDASYGNVVTQFTTGGNLHIILYDGFSGGGGSIGYAPLKFSSVSFSGVCTEITLVDTGYYTTLAYVGSERVGQPTNADKVIRGEYSHAEGYESVAHAQHCHAEGFRTKASGDMSHSEGNATVARGEQSHAEGSNTQAIGIGSHAEGYFTKAQGDLSHAEGRQTESIGQYSHAEGYWTITSGSYQHAAGKFNRYGNNHSLMVVGNGTSDGSRSDIFRIETTSVQTTGSVWQKSIAAGNSTIGFMGDDAIVDPTTKGSDVFFYTSGSIRSAGTSTRGTSLFGGDVVVSGSLSLGSGSNLPTGIVYLDGGNPGVATVTNSLVTANSMIFLTKQANNNPSAGPPVVSAKTAGSFTITCNHNGDTDPVAYLIINPANS